MKNEEISKVRIIFIANATIYLIITILLLSIMLDFGGFNWFFYGLALVCWIIAAIGSYAFFKDDQQGKTTTSSIDLETALLGFFLKILFTPARLLGERKLKI